MSEHLEWDQADLGEGFSTLNHGMISIVAWNKERIPTLIGSAFVIGAYGETAIALTAAHNFKGIRDVQLPHRRHHLTALPEFLGNMEEINLAVERVRGICADRKGFEVAPILWAAWDKNADIGILALETQEKGKAFFESHFLLDDNPIVVGDEICVLGYAEMKIPDQAIQADGKENFSVSRRLLLRKGRVTALYQDGHLLCRGPCVETSIPVFAGMSGGLACKFGKAGESIASIGVISSDPESDIDSKNNRKIRGASIVALPNSKIIQGSKSRQVLIQFNAGLVQSRAE